MIVKSRVKKSAGDGHAVCREILRSIFQKLKINFGFFTCLELNGKMLFISYFYCGFFVFFRVETNFVLANLTKYFFLNQIWNFFNLHICTKIIITYFFI